MKILKKSTAVLLLLAMLLSMGQSALALSDSALDAAIQDTAAYVHKTVKNPQVGSVGGEWAVMELARSDYDVPEEYFQRYYATLAAYVEDCKGVLHQKKYTEYSRVILALTAIGKDPADVAGYNLLTPLGDYDKTIWQGLNGPIWALIALDTGNYPMPKNPDAKTQATRDLYVDRILECQLADGGFSLFGGTAYASQGDQIADPDITGMALQALAKYRSRTDVKQAIDKALSCMSKQQNAQGGFSSWGTPNSESVVQVIVALCELGIPLDDSRFVKNGHTLLDNLMTYYLPGKGFMHTASGSGSNQMATEQALYGLIAAQRLRDGRPSLYRMTDALSIGDAVGGTKPGEGLPGKNAAVKPLPVTQPGRTFDDISGDHYHANAPAIETLASRGVLGGRTPDRFEPEATMTRAEFAATVTRALGIGENKENPFTDIKPGSWYEGYIGAASAWGIVSGRTADTFDPEGIITRQEAAVMVARAAKLCGMDTERDTAAIRDTLSQFPDYVKAYDWTRSSLAFCYEKDILSEDDDNIRPGDVILRSEIAQMIFNLLGEANLL